MKGFYAISALLCSLDCATCNVNLCNGYGLAPHGACACSADRAKVATEARYESSPLERPAP